MQTKPILAHADVARILAAARAEALAQQWPVSIAVVDDGGHLLGLERLDGATASSAYIATEKARTAALTRRETEALEQVVNGGRTAFLAAPNLTPLGGGVPVQYQGQVIGAVGVSGVKPDQDAQVAKAGAAVLGEKP
ncbi:heme-binding protein [Pseudomonas sp. NPDC007930]|uniref:GlcG/HbpS family heme-binding protein n=1 Tax=Pseudomonas sp. NPDC007930 TaxID=3364417 RepID=UPI0036E64718